MKQHTLKIRPLYLTLYLCLVIERIANPQGTPSNVCAQISVLADIVNLLILLLLVALFCRIQPKASCFLKKYSALQKAAAVVGTVFFCAAAGQTAATAYLFLNLSVDRRFSAVVFLSLAIGLACYAAHLGQQGIMRVGEILTALFMVAVLLIFLSNMKHADFSNLRQSDAPLVELSGTVFNGFSLPMTLAAWAMFASDKERKNPHRLQKTLTAVFATSIVFAIAGELVLGNMAAVESQPFYLLAKVGSLSVFQRLAPVHSFVFLMLLIQKLCFLVAAALQSIPWGGCVPSRLLPVVGVASFCGAFVFLSLPAGAGTFVFSIGALFVLLCGTPTEKRVQDAA